MPAFNSVKTSTIRTVGLFAKYADKSVGEVIQRLCDFLHDRELKVVMEEAITGLPEMVHAQCLPPDEIAGAIDLAIVVGGDGTMLHVARQLAANRVPLIGVNLGRLGFLTDIPKDNMLDSLAAVLDGEFRSEERILLKVELWRDGKILRSANALNDVVVNKGQLARLIEFEVYVDDDFVSSTRADGIIVSTPTGSTAYALSAGGPILYPTMAALALVPICPHTLSNRPVVIDSNSRIEIAMTDSSQESAYLSFDGQMGYGLQDNDRIRVCRADHPVTLIHPAERNHFDVLRTKLRWGEKF